MSNEKRTSTGSAILQELLVKDGIDEFRFMEMDGVCLAYVPSMEDAEGYHNVPGYEGVLSGYLYSRFFINETVYNQLSDHNFAEVLAREYTGIKAQLVNYMRDLADKIEGTL